MLNFVLNRFETAIESGQPKQAQAMIDEFVKGNNKDHEVPGKCFKSYVIEALNQLKAVGYRSNWSKIVLIHSKRLGRGCSFKGLLSIIEPSLLSVLRQYLFLPFFAR